MKIYFLENENPNKDSSGGIMSYLINLSNSESVISGLSF